jgi:hypothetical protein
MYGSGVLRGGLMLALLAMELLQIMGAFRLFVRDMIDKGGSAKIWNGTADLLHSAKGVLRK